MTLVYILGSIVVFIGVSAFFGAPYVPSRRRDVKGLFDSLAPITKNDTVLDMGSGDGLVLREVSRRGARAIGYEIHPLFVGISRTLSAGDPHVRVQWANAWTAPITKDVTLIYIFSVGRDGKKLEQKIQHEANRLRHPLRLVCYGNALPTKKPQGAEGAYYLYVFEPLHLGQA